MRNRLVRRKIHIAVNGDEQVSIGLDVPMMCPTIVAVLRDRGLTQEEIEKMCSGNWLCVVNAVRA